MAIISNVCSFRVIYAVLWVFLVIFFEAFGEPVHLMSVTPTPFGANQSGAQVICLLSDPDTDKLDGISTGKHIKRGKYEPYDTFALPPVTNYTDNVLNKYTTDLPDSKEAQGVFYCEASNGQGVSTRVPVTILTHDRRFEPLDGFTVTANVGESVTLNAGIRVTPTGDNPDNDVRWQKQQSNFPTYSGRRVVSNAAMSSFTINPVTVDDMAVYATYWAGRRAPDFRFSLIRLIVRECPSGKWGPPSCISICDNCYNGGICDDKTGECVCRPGFMGPNCLTACGQDKFGWACEHQCGSGLAVPSCPRSMFSMPDPTGCSCITGWKGIECDQVCLDGEFGAGCTETCHCDAGVACDRYTGECPGECATGWSGPACQVPDVCPSGYWGSECTGKCGCVNCNKDTGSCLLSPECLPGFAGPNCELECHCLEGASCDRMSGRCQADANTGLSLCEPGYVSDTGVNLDNCAQYEGCFDGCTMTCHCQGGVDSCNPVTGECTPTTVDGKMCKDAWIGTSCQTGIVSLTYEKTNPEQPMIVTCVVTSDSGEPDSNEVHLYYVNDDSTLRDISQMSAAGNRNYLTVVFEAYPLDGQLVICNYQFQDGADTLYAQAEFTSEYYVLPRLTEAPTIVAGSVNTTSVTIQWNVWDPNRDPGDGPVIGYKIYYANPTGIMMEGVFIPSISQTQTQVETIESLQPGTEYKIQVSVVREGPGGDGEPGPTVSVTTLPLTTQPPSTTRPLTNQPPSTTRPLTTQPPSTTHPLTTQLPSSTTRPLITQLPSTIHLTSPSQPTMDTGVAKPSSSLTSITVAVVMIVLVILLFIIALILFIRWRQRKQPKRYPASVVASDADLDRLSQVLADPNVIDTKSVASLEHFVNLGYEESTDDIDDVKPRPFSHPTRPLQLSPLPPDSPALRKRAETAMSSSSSIKLRLHIPSVNVKDFTDYMKKKRQTTDLKVEWESLPKGLAKPATIAKKLENKGKNRFRNVVAYDHSRIGLEPLERDPHSDYINACYIEGIKNPKAYIATQGPNEKTLGDFFRLIWQEEVEVMVMACNLIEEGKPKCSKYWPEMNEPISFGDISVVLNGQEKKGKECTVRRLTISKDGDGNSREITQLHYTEWPDKDVPKHCTPVLKFIKEIKKHHDRKAPLLIHCSAGAGRTGTLIAIHAMMDLADDKKQLDIYNFIFSMRNSRPHMVQTADQYIFTHDAMLEYLVCKETFVTADEFATQLKSLQETNPQTGNTYLEDEFEILNLVSPHHKAMKTRASHSQEGIAKMRSADSLPVDSSRPFLMTPRDDGDPSAFINAAFLNGYEKKDMFISTQMPLSHTVVDLWRLMYDYNCTCIVQLNAMDLYEEEDCPQYWPDKGTNDYGPFTVSLMSQESTPDFEMRTLQLVYTKNDLKSPISVRHFQYKTWPRGDEKPASSVGILQLISAVEKWQKTHDTPGPIVVLCMNAAGRTGAFCAIQTCCEQVREEQGVDVLQNVKQLRIHRTNVVDTSAKYLFCYEAILEYLKAFDINNDVSSLRPKLEDDLYVNVPAIRTPTTKKRDRKSQPDDANLPLDDGVAKKGEATDRKSDDKVIYDNIPSNGALGEDQKTGKDGQKASQPVSSATSHDKTNGTALNVSQSPDADDVELRLYGNIPSIGTPKVDRKATDDAKNHASSTPTSSRKSRKKRTDSGKSERNGSANKSAEKKPKEGDQVYQNTVFEAYSQ